MPLPFPTKQDLALYFRVSVRTIDRWVAVGTIPAPLRLRLRIPRWRARDISRVVNRNRKKCVVAQNVSAETRRS
ncbi:MAG: hypothetical protein IPM17_17505 [Verrucomicrobia bacterium]|nr:hypothetical protein [Verrucomicrobiota bacterium]